MGIPNQTTWGRTQPATRWLLLLMTLAVTALLMTLTAPPTSAGHAGAPGTCGPSEIKHVGPSDEVKAAFPSTSPGTEIVYEVHCRAGDPNKLQPEDLKFSFWRTTATGGEEEVIVALARTVYEDSGGTERLQTNEIHLPVETPPSITKVCVNDVCVPVNGS